MRERLPGTENGNKSDWEVFVQKNPDLEKLQEKDPEGYDLVRSYFEIRQFQKSAIYRADDEKAKEMLKSFSDKVDGLLLDDEKRAEKLEPFFTEIRDL